MNRMASPGDGTVRAGAQRRWSRQGSKRLGVAILLLMAASPLQWYSVTNAAVGSLKPFHLAALVLALVLLTLPGAGKDFRRLCRATAILAFLVPAFVVLTATAAYWWGRPLTTVVRDSSYVFGGLVIGWAFVRFRHDEWLRRRTLWSATLAVTSFTVFAQLSLPATNLFAIVIDAIRKAEPRIIQYELFAPLFQSEGVQAQANLRHGVFIAVLFAAWITVASLDQLPFVSRFKRVIIYLSLVVSVGMVLMSLSRAAIVALVLPCVGLAFRPVVRGRLGSKGLVGAGMAMVGMFLGVVTGAFTIVWERFATETGSYAARTEVTSETFARLGDAAVLGTGQTELAPHNFVLNSLVEGGAVLALVALAILLTVMVLAARMWWPWASGREVDLLQFVGFALLAIPIVRMFTAAAGLTLVEWAAVAIAAVWHHQRKTSTSTLRLPARLRGELQEEEAMMLPVAVDTFKEHHADAVPGPVPRESNSR